MYDEYKYPFFNAENSGMLVDSNYYYYILDKIYNAKKSILAVIFIVNIRRVDDPDQNILTLLEELEYAKWRGIDVKLIIGSSEKAPLISISNETAYRYLKNRNFPIKYGFVDKKSLHSKYVIFDKKLVVLGSHNWTNNAMFNSSELSVFCYSKDCAIKLEKEFYYLWEYGGNPTNEVSGKE